MYMINISHRESHQANPRDSESHQKLFLLSLHHFVELWLQSEDLPLSSLSLIPQWILREPSQQLTLISSTWKESCRFCSSVRISWKTDSMLTFFLADVSMYVHFHISLDMKRKKDLRLVKETSPLPEHHPDRKVQTLVMRQLQCTLQNTVLATFYGPPLPHVRPANNLKWRF